MILVNIPLDCTYGCVWHGGDCAKKWRKNREKSKKKDARKKKKMSQTLNINFAASPLGFLLLPVGAAGFRIFGASFETDSLCENALMTCHFDRKIVFVLAV